MRRTPPVLELVKVSRWGKFVCVCSTFFFVVPPLNYPCWCIGLWVGKWAGWYSKQFLYFFSEIYVGQELGQWNQALITGVENNKSIALFFLSVPHIAVHICAQTYNVCVPRCMTIPQNMSASVCVFRERQTEITRGGKKKLNWIVERQGEIDYNQCRSEGSSAKLKTHWPVAIRPGLCVVFLMDAYCQHFHWSMSVCFLTTALFLICPSLVLCFLRKLEGKDV